jgi:hypothetical protein
MGIDVLLEKTFKFVAAGGRLEIVQYCRGELNEWFQTDEISILYHHHEIFQWIFENKLEIKDKDFFPICDTSNNVHCAI